MPLLYGQNITQKTQDDCQRIGDSLYHEVHQLLGADNVKSLFISQQLYKHYKKCNTKEIEYLAYDALCWAYLYVSNFPEAIRYGDKALEVAIQLNDTTNIINSYNVLGNIYIELPDKDFALKNFEKGLEYATQFNDLDMVSNLNNNIAIAFEMFGELTTSLEYYKKAKKYFEQSYIRSDKGLIYLNIGDLYLQLKEYDSATYYLSKSRSLLSLETDEYLLQTLYLCLAEEQSIKQNFKKAIVYLDSCYILIDKGGAPTDFINYYKLRAEILQKSGNSVDAYTTLYKAFTLKDSLLSKDILNKLRDVQIGAIADQKEAEILELTQKSTIQDLKIAEQQAAQNTYLLGIVSVTIVLLFLVIVIFNNIQKNQKLRQRSIVIELQSKDISLKNNQLEQINKEITDSIFYAKRIQNAILPSPRLVKTHLPDSFILYKPKDIVAGDFYWLEVKEEKILIAAADCTGHGVPGAMVSVVCNNGLNRSVREHGITETGKILDKTTEIIIQEFGKSDDDVKDGMDISLCSLSKTDDPNTVIVEWSGANNPLWIIKNPNTQSREFKELKPDKQPIGKYAETLPFKTHTFELKKGDLIYLLTDGFQDQFGGVNGKKYKALQLKELLLSICDKDLQEQNRIIDTQFEQWKGNLEQIDDVCIIGVRIS